MMSSCKATRSTTWWRRASKGLIIIAEDGDAAVTPVEKAAAAGVKVISYDRLIKTAKISAYLSFDNIEVGKAEADGVVKALGSTRIAPPGRKPTRPRSSCPVVPRPITMPSWSARARWKSSSPTSTGVDQGRGRPVGGQLGSRQGRNDDGEHPHRAAEQDRRGGGVE